MNGKIFKNKNGIGHDIIAIDIQRGKLVTTAEKRSRVKLSYHFWGKGGGGCRVVIEKKTLYGNLFWVNFFYLYDRLYVTSLSYFQR